MKKALHAALRAITILLLLAAVATLLPNPAASKDCMLGYASLCTAAPLSTFSLLLSAGVIHAVNVAKLGGQSSK